MSERFAAEPGPAWIDLPSDEQTTLWAQFQAHFSFRASMDSERWPAITEPTPSLTFSLAGIPDGAMRGAAYDAINAEALRSFVWALPDVDELVVHDWQHPSYRFRPAVHALHWNAEWKVPVFPDGDYFAFVTADLAEGTFGHPWEQSLCVLGARLCGSLGRSLATWLPVVREDGRPR